MELQVNSLSKMSETSQKQLEANQQNAKLGGVKTEEGKAISRFNALKHGLLSREVLLKDEDEENLIELGKRLREELKPATEIELVLVDRVTTNIWRLRRAMKIEREMIENETKSDYLSGSSKTLGAAFISDLGQYGSFDKFMRYENSIERGIYKALHELQRLQTSRSGEKVQAPIAIDVDISKDD